MPINTDTLNAIISGLNTMPKKSEIDTPTNNIDLLATNTTDGLMSSSDKSKLDGIAVGANKYVHPKTSGNKHIPSGGSDGQILKWESDGTAKWATETKYGIATETSGGLMSSTDKTNLDEAVKKLKTIDDNANYYRLPTASNTTKGGVTTTSTVTSTSGLIACPIINGVPYYHDTTVSYDLPTASNTTKGGVTTTSTVTSTSGLTACPIIAGVPYYNDGSTYALRSLYSDTTINIGRKSGTTVGAYSVAEGSGTTASGNYSHAEGSGTTASGESSHAEGENTTASGKYSHAEGNATTASRDYSHAEGYSTNKVTDAITDFSTSTSNDDIITAWKSTKFSLAKGDYSHCEGYDTLALGNSSHAEGYYTKASGQASHAEGYGAKASGKYSHAEGNATTASRDYSHAEGDGTTASGYMSHAEGSLTTASGYISHAEGTQTTASGGYSHAEGFDTTASRSSSHSEGEHTSASGQASHAEGAVTIASGDYSHTEGLRTTASGQASHAEGNSNKKLSSVITDFSSSTSNADIIAAWTNTKFSLAKGNSSHSEGSNTLALGDYSHAEGDKTIASGPASHAEGLGTIASKTAESASGKYNLSNSDTLYSVGDGTSNEARHNAFEITTDGGKLHDKDIVTTDLIPTSLPANGGNADTLDGLHASDFMPINGDVIKDGLIRMNGTSGIRVRHIDGNDTEFDGALYLNYGSPNAPIYMNGTNTAIHSGNIGSQSVNYATNAGNATNSDTVDGIHVNYTNDAGSGTNWLAAFVTSNDIHAIDPARAYVGNAGTANMVRSLLIGTSANCAYNTILAWANSQTGTAYASVVDGDGYPSDGPYQNEAMLKVESDYYGSRKIVTWTRYLAAKPRLVMIRTIFNGGWNDDQWRT